MCLKSTEHGKRIMQFVYLKLHKLHWDCLLSSVVTNSKNWRGLQLQKVEPIFSSSYSKYLSHILPQLLVNSQYFAVVDKGLDKAARVNMSLNCRSIAFSQIKRKKTFRSTFNYWGKASWVSNMLTTVTNIVVEQSSDNAESHSVCVCEIQMDWHAYVRS